MPLSVKLTGQRYVTAFYAGAADGSILRTIDGAATWSLLGTLPAAARAMAWWTPDRGLAACSSGVYLTTDGGLLWTQVVAGNYYGVAVTGTSNAVACGASAALKYTRDGGASWTDSTKPGISTTALYAVASCDYPSKGEGYMYALCGAAYSGATVYLLSTDEGAVFAADPAGAPGTAAMYHLDIAPTGTNAYCGVISGDMSNAYLAYAGFAAATGEGFGASCGALITADIPPVGAVAALVGGDAQLNRATNGATYAVPTGWPLTVDIHALAAVRSCRRIAMVVTDTKSSVTMDGGATWSDRAHPGVSIHNGCLSTASGYLTLAPSLILPVRQ